VGHCDGEAFEFVLGVGHVDDLQVHTALGLEHGGVGQISASVVELDEGL